MGCAGENQTENVQNLEEKKFKCGATSCINSLSPGGRKRNYRGGRGGLKSGHQKVTGYLKKKKGEPWPDNKTSERKLRGMKGSRF